MSLYDAMNQNPVYYTEPYSNPTGPNEPKVNPVTAAWRRFRDKRQRQAGKSLKEQMQECARSGEQMAHQAVQEYGHAKAAANDMKYLHCTTACYIQQECSKDLPPWMRPFIGTLVAGGGIYHEVEYGVGIGDAPKLDNQPPLDWMWDTPGDIVANTCGQVCALLRKDCKECCKCCGDNIPGPNHAGAVEEWQRRGGGANDWPEMGSHPSPPGRGGSHTPPGTPPAPPGSSTAGPFPHGSSENPNVPNTPLPPLPPPPVPPAAFEGPELED